MTVCETPSNCALSETRPQVQPPKASATFRVWLLTVTCLGADGILLLLFSYFNNQPSIYPYEYVLQQMSYYGLLIAAPLVWLAWAAVWSCRIAAPALNVFEPKRSGYLEALWFLPALALTLGWDYAFRELLQKMGFLHAHRWHVEFFVSGVILCPLFEEVVFRRLLFRHLTTRMTVLKAALLSSLVFALAHFGSYHPLPWSEFLGGLFFCGLYWWRKTLVAPIAAHMGGNLAVALVETFLLR